MVSKLKQCGGEFAASSVDVLMATSSPNALCSENSGDEAQYFTQCAALNTKKANFSLQIRVMVEAIDRTLLAHPEPLPKISSGVTPVSSIDYPCISPVKLVDALSRTSPFPKRSAPELGEKTFNFLQFSSYLKEVEVRSFTAKQRIQRLKAEQTKLLLLQDAMDCSHSRTKTVSRVESVGIAARSKGARGKSRLGGTSSERGGDSSRLEPVGACCDSPWRKESIIRSKGTSHTRSTTRGSSIIGQRSCLNFPPLGSCESLCNVAPELSDSSKCIPQLTFSTVKLRRFWQLPLRTRESSDLKNGGNSLSVDQGEKNLVVEPALSSSESRASAYDALVSTPERLSVKSEEKLKTSLFNEVGPSPRSFVDAEAAREFARSRLSNCGIIVHFLLRPERQRDDSSPLPTPLQSVHMLLSRMGQHFVLTPLPTGPWGNYSIGSSSSDRSAALFDTLEAVHRIRSTRGAVSLKSFPKCDSIDHTILWRSPRTQHLRIAAENPSNRSAVQLIRRRPLPSSSRCCRVAACKKTYTVLPKSEMSGKGVVTAVKALHEGVNRVLPFFILVLRRSSIIFPWGSIKERVAPAGAIGPPLLEPGLYCGRETTARILRSFGDVSFSEWGNGISYKLYVYVPFSESRNSLPNYNRVDELSFKLSPKISSLRPVYRTPNDSRLFIIECETRIDWVHLLICCLERNEGYASTRSKGTEERKETGKHVKMTAGKALWMLAAYRVQIYLHQASQGKRRRQRFGYPSSVSSFDQD